MAPTGLESQAGWVALAMVRYMPALVLAAYSPLRWAPATIRITLALGLAWLTVLSREATPCETSHCSM